MTYPSDKNELFHKHSFDSEDECVYCGEKKNTIEFTQEEIKTLYKLLEHEYISYENTAALEIVRKLRNIVDANTK